MSRILGFEIGEEAVRGAIAEARLGFSRHLKSVEIPVPLEGAERRKSIVEALALWKTQFSPDRVVIGLPLRLFSWRHVEMPPMKRSDFRRALAFELEKYLPLPVDEYAYDFLVVREKEKRDRKTKVLVLSIRKDAVQETVKIVREAGMEPSAVRCSTFSILFGVLDTAGIRGGQGTFVRAAEGGHEIAVFRDGSPVVLKGTAGSDLAAEIAEVSAAHPGTLYIAGVADQSLVERSGGRRLHIDEAAMIALSGVKRSPLFLNFLPPEMMKPKRDYYPFLIGGVAVASVVLFLLTGFVSYFKDRRALDGVEAEISAIKERSSGVIDARKRLDHVLDDRRIVIDFQNKSNHAIRAMSELSSVLPKDAWLLSLSIDEKGRVEIEGFAKRTSEVLIALEKSKVFSNLAFSAPIISREGKERFAIRMEVGADEKK